MFVEEMHCPINVFVQLLLCKVSVEGPFHYIYVCCGTSLCALTSSLGSLPMDGLMDAPFVMLFSWLALIWFQW